MSLADPLPRLPPSHPSDAWMAAFAEQCTAALYVDAKRFAARRAGAVRKQGGLVDDYYVRELVQNVLADTVAGVLRWDPTIKALAEHVWDSIRTRTNHDRIRAERFQHEPIDVFDPAAPGDLLGEIEAALEDRAASPTPELAPWTAELLATCRRRAAGSPTILRMLNAIEDGATTRAEVMQATGMSEVEYHAARVRLGRWALKLSPHRLPIRRRVKKGA
jgi:hypothetical protein